MRVSRKTGSSGGIDGAPAAAGIPYLAGQVKADSFLDKALAFGRMAGHAKDEWPVVRIGTAAFAAWIAYMAGLGLRTAFAERHGVLTVPAGYPWDFSVDADRLRIEFDPDDWRDETRAAPIITNERRRELSAVLRGMMPREMRRAAAKRARSYDPDTPVTPSPELREKLAQPI